MKVKLILVRLVLINANCLIFVCFFELMKIIWIDKSFYFSYSEIL
jgi:hypothetical protein